MLSKKDQIYQEILSRLFSGRYRFGEPIPVKEISEETGVSRQPIMTALYRLQDNGFVRITAQVGCEVVRPTVEEVSDFFYFNLTREWYYPVFYQHLIYIWLSSTLCCKD